MNAITIKELIAYGVLISLHWLAFYGAIQYSSASVALIGLATASFWASLLEPLLQAKRPSQLEMLLGILIIPGMVLIAGSLHTNMWFGLGLGVLSALLSALFSVLNKDVVQKYSSLDISFIELMGALVFLTILLPTTVSHPLFYGWIPTWKDFLYLLVLALVCTTVAYVLSLRALWLQLTAQHRSIIWNNTAEHALKAPVAGTGAGMMYQLDEEGAMSAPGNDILPANARHAHNVFLQTWFELGAIGAALLALFGLSLIEAIQRSARRAQAYGHAMMAAAMCLTAASYGMWQAWFLAMFALAVIGYTLAVSVNARGA